MIPTAIEEYARHCEFQRTAHALDDKPDFKLYVVEGVAYLQPINLRASDFLNGFDLNHKPWHPIRLTAYDLDVLTDQVKRGCLKITMENVELDANTLRVDLGSLMK